MTNYYVIICAIAKDETPYIEEWITYHLNLGVDFFVIYDNKSKIPLSHTLANFIALEKVRVIECPINDSQQLKAYNHCLYEMNNKTEWIAFIDIDEFIVLHQHLSIKDFLSTFEDFQGVCLNWLNYNASGHIEASDQHVFKRFDQHLPYEHSINRHVKSIVRPRHVTVMANPHYAHFDLGYYAVNENRRQVLGAFSNFSNKKAHINHYITKSFEEWVKKVAKGRVDTIMKRSISSFWELNESMVHLKANLMKTYKLDFDAPKLKTEKHQIELFSELDICIHNLSASKIIYWQKNRLKNKLNSCSYILFISLYSRFKRNRYIETMAFDLLQKKCDDLLSVRQNEDIFFSMSRVGSLLCYFNSNDMLENPSDILNSFDYFLMSLSSPLRHKPNFAENLGYSLYLLGRMKLALEMSKTSEYDDLVGRLLNFFPQLELLFLNLSGDQKNEVNFQNELVVYLYIPFLTQAVELTGLPFFGNKVEQAYQILKDILKCKKSSLQSNKGSLKCESPDLIIHELLFEQARWYASDAITTDQLKKENLSLLQAKIYQLFVLAPLNSIKVSLAFVIIISFCRRDQVLNSCVFNRLVKFSGIWNKDVKAALIKKPILFNHFLSAYINNQVMRNNWFARYAQIFIQLDCISNGNWK